ncbi:glutamate synthase (NADPH/NADH) small chain [Actinopolymorpha cephalotaxi]|uniref:Glutamate synthase (NADPH/NADH) small chain n=1 Tax=Actinopolymorpha cephalotaxi TaxID=504797 RepID=A0A1I2LS91_9ACTN|nr:glutamate synthase subunit beta [Actinopolymorpha cephalotaxi]NYH81349.1 glutamate synthase (NADPH/NADH) small chain [Actinopolymorpha cephalotaxi]SFF80247.1 glutamate synthase (NADPH/NADH) small chain [Actinopolymorpha cephalotaxi]
MPAEPWGFLHHARVEFRKRPIAERLRDWRAVLQLPLTETARTQAARCMDCGVPFCHAGCPLGNLIPEWNEYVARGEWHRALDSLHSTNNFPEFTGWLCPAPCEPACVLAINASPVSIKQVELAIIEHAWARDWVRPCPAPIRTGRRVAVVGSGPAGLAAAQQLARAGHDVHVFERDDRIGGLLRYGIPDFKLEKRVVDRRLGQLAAEGVRFRPGVDAGTDVSGEWLRARYDAVVLAVGALRPREVDLPGRGLAGVHQAMDYLPQANRVAAGDLRTPTIDAYGRHVVIIGGGDTGADCLGTANRQGAVEVRQLDHNPRPPELRDDDTNPWPQWPRVHRVSPAHEEGVVEDWSREVVAFAGDEQGHVRRVRTAVVERRFDAHGHRWFHVVRDSEEDLPAELVLLAAGFVGPDTVPLLDQLEVQLDPRTGTVLVDDEWETTAPGVYSCGDAQRGASLVVWAIAEGRACAARVDRALTGRGVLPEPVAPSSRPL